MPQIVHNVLFACVAAVAIIRMIRALEGCNGKYLYANIICDPMVVGILSLIYSRQKAQPNEDVVRYSPSLYQYICLWNSVTLANYVVMPTTPPLNHIVYIDE